MQHLRGSASVLQRVCSICAATLGVDGAGVSQYIDGDHRPLAASDANVITFEAMQARLREGPGIDVVSTKRPSMVPDLRSRNSHDRWPTFAPAALQSGVGAVFAFPLFTQGVAVGALDLYAAEAGELDDNEVEDALILADLAGLAVVGHLDETSIDGVDASTEPQEPWAYAAVVHHASGMVSEQLEIDVGSALLRLRAVAFATDRDVADIARDIVARRLRLDAWSAEG
ncbi:MAG: hypothetical protein JWM34_4617 [Ilumatobacteraceae bacterium]|nr:hypothetical protein [Ilumatobacteraceae bacterium]